MPRYVVQHRYASKRDGVQWGPWDAGQPIDLREDDAAWVNLDSPGCLALEVQVPPPAAPVEPEPTPDLEQVDGDVDGEREGRPSRNRQARPGRNRSI